MKEEGRESPAPLLESLACFGSDFFIEQICKLTDLIPSLLSFCAGQPWSILWFFTSRLWAGEKP
jgi:hypothetical protein